MLAAYGILMNPLPIGTVGGVFLAALAFGLVLNVVKIPIFRSLQIA
jgi:hypothetical protein